MRVYLGAAPGGEATNLALAHALARRADQEEDYETVHVYQPTGQSVVFGRRETRLPGFPAAVHAARDAGFVPLIRATGGRAVAYTEQTVVVHHVRHDAEPTKGHDARFQDFGASFADILGRLGVAARLGPVPGEYCPGAHSVNARGEVKLVGTAQRILRRAWLFASLVMVADEAAVRPVLTEVYGHLGQDFDPMAVGSVSSENPVLDTETVAVALLEVYAQASRPDPIAQAGEALAVAARSVADHSV